MLPELCRELAILLAMAASAFLATVPDGLSPGDQFLADCEGTRVWVEVPEAVRPGSKVQFICPNPASELKMPQEIVDEFNRCDVDGDGTISAIELKKLFDRLGFDEEEGRLLFEQGDCNDDGELNMAEFSYLFEKLKVKIAERECAQLKERHEQELATLRAATESKLGATEEEVAKAKKAYENGKASREASLNAERQKQRQKLEERIKQRTKRRILSMDSAT